MQTTGNPIAEQICAEFIGQSCTFHLSSRVQYLRVNQGHGFDTAKYDRQMRIMRIMENDTPCVLPFIRPWKRFRKQNSAPLGCFLSYFLLAFFTAWVSVVFTRAPEPIKRCKISLLLPFDQSGPIHENEYSYSLPAGPSHLMKELEVNMTCSLHSLVPAPPSLALLLDYKEGSYYNYKRGALS